MSTRYISNLIDRALNPFDISNDSIFNWPWIRNFDVRETVVQVNIYMYKYSFFYVYSFIEQFTRTKVYLIRKQCYLYIFTSISF